MAEFNICIVGETVKNATIELAELIAASLQELGHQVGISISEIRLDKINIVLGAHLLGKHSLNLPSNTIIVNTEQLASLEHSKRENYVEWYRRG